MALAGGLGRAQAQAEGDVLPGHAASFGHVEQAQFEAVEFGAGQGQQGEGGHEVVVVDGGFAGVGLGAAGGQVGGAAQGVQGGHGAGVGLPADAVLAGGVALGEAGERGVGALFAGFFGVGRGEVGCGHGSSMTGQPHDVNIGFSTMCSSQWWARKSAKVTVPTARSGARCSPAR